MASPPPLCHPKTQAKRDVLGRAGSWLHGVSRPPQTAAGSPAVPAPQQLSPPSRAGIHSAPSYGYGRQRGPALPPAALRLHPPSHNFLSCFSFLAISFRKSLELRWPILGGGRLPPVQFWVLPGTAGREERREGPGRLRDGQTDPSPTPTRGQTPSLGRAPRPDPAGPTPAAVPRPSSALHKHPRCSPSPRGGLRSTAAGGDFFHPPSQRGKLRHGARLYQAP